MHDTFLSYFKPRPLLATDDPPNQTEQHTASRQCDEAPGERASASDDGLGCFRVAKGGDRISATSLNRKLTKCGHLEVKIFHLVSLILSLL